MKRILEGKKDPGTEGREEKNQFPGFREALQKRSNDDECINSHLKIWLMWENLWLLTWVFKDTVFT